MRVVAVVRGVDALLQFGRAMASTADYELALAALILIIINVL